MIPLDMAREHRSRNILDIQLDPYKDATSDHTDASNSCERLESDVCTLLRATGDAHSRVHTSLSFA